MLLIAGLLLLQTPSDTAPAHPIYDRMAQTIAAAATETEHPDTRGWVSVGQRTRSVRWHLAPPDIGDDWYRRTGWISESGRQAGVAACGGTDGVAVLGLQISGEEPEPVMDALVRIGTVVREADDSGLPVWWFEQAGREAAMVTASSVCTPPGSAAARTCRLHATVFYQLDFRDRGCTAP